MSVLIYRAGNSWEQKRVNSNEAIQYLLNGWFITPHSAIKEVK